MLDPVKNARVVGLLLIVFGAISAFVSFFDLMKFQDLPGIIAFGTAVGKVVTGFGLRQTKAWAIYGIGALIGVELVIILFDYLSGTQTPLNSIVWLIVMVVLFFWLFSARKKFS